MFRKLSTASSNSVTESSESETPPTGGGARKLSLLMMKAMASSGPRDSIISEDGEQALMQTDALKPRPSLVNVLASKRFARRMSKRFSIGGYGGFGRTVTSSRVSDARSVVKKEPTYRMEPYRKFCVSKVEQVIKNILESTLDGLKYDPRVCAAQCKSLSEELKDRVKLLNYDRYKIVASVVIGESRDQGVMTASRCAWDEKFDGMANYCYQSPHIFCSATVYGLYTE